VSWFRRCHPRKPTLTEMSADAAESLAEAKQIAANSEEHLSDMERRQNQNHIYEAVLDMIKHRPQGGQA
jgi:hypothetical protein